MALRSKWTALAGMVVGLGSLGAAPAPALSITVKDLTPKFLTFYRAATAANASPDERFKLWKADYDFAAVPPTPQGDVIARRLLDQAWPKYPGVIARIERGAAGVAPSPEATLRRVAAELHPDGPVRLNLLVYVGALEGNAFTAAEGRKVTVALPVEQGPYERGPMMAHEFVHAVHISMGTNAGGWIRTIGETVLAEGLAMRVAQHLYPDRPAASFVEMSTEPGWLAKSEGQRSAILTDVKSALASNKSDDLLRFTMGAGPTGLDREAYYAGWVVVDYWTRHGLSFADIARIPEAQAPGRVGAAIDAILAGG